MPNPVRARDPLPCDGAKPPGGRRNTKRRAAHYTEMSVLSTVAEANQLGRRFVPVTLLWYEADLSRIPDATDPAHLAAQAKDADAFAADDWRGQMLQAGRSRRQGRADALIAAGYSGLILPSFARGVAVGVRNLVLWRWHRLRLVDSEGRLQ